VILLSDERGIVAEKFAAPKEIAARVATYMAGQSDLRMVVLRSCPKVRADIAQAVMNDLQKGRFIAVLDLHEPDTRICER
jgi:hypothetical protein